MIKRWIERIGSHDTPRGSRTITIVSTSSPLLTSTDGSPATRRLTVARQGTIVDDDSPPATNLSIRIADAGVAEGHSGTTNMGYWLTLNRASTTPVTAAYTTVNGTARAGTDFIAATGADAVCSSWVPTAGALSGIVRP